MEKPKYPLFKDRAITLWGQLADHLQYRLDSCEFRGKLPPLSTFSAEYGVTSTTVQRAISDLKQRGLLTSLPDREGLYPTGHEPFWGISRYHWRDLAWKIHDKCPEVMDLHSYGAPRPWRDGFRADVWRHEGQSPSET